MRSRTMRVAGVVAALGCAAVARSSGAPSLRDLPTVIERWSYPDGAVAMLSLGDRLLAAGTGSVALLDAASGRVQWRTKVEAEDCYDCPLALVGERVAYGVASKLHLLDLESGELAATVELPGNVSMMAGPPLVALVGTEGGSLLVAVDAERSEIQASQRLAGNAYDLALADGVVAVIVGGGSNGAGEDRIEGYDARSLRLLWSDQGSVFPDFERREGRVYVQTSDSGCDCDSAFLPLDFRTGKRGAPLPLREQTEWSVDLPWDLQIHSPKGDEATAAAEARGVFTLRRNDATTGKPRWRASLPGRPDAVARDADRLLALSSSDGARAVLTVLDWETGEVSRVAFGLPADVLETAASGKLLLVRSEDGLRAFDTEAFGAPEGRSRSVASQVEKILLATAGDDSVIGRGDYLRNRLAELELIGAPACAAIPPLLPRLGPTSIAAAAAFVERHRCPKAADGLARLLAGPLEYTEAGWPEWKPPLAILHALALLGSEAQVPPVAAILEETKGPAEMRQAAFTALASIGSPSAVAALRGFLASPPPARVVFSPPDPLAFLAFAGQPSARPDRVPDDPAASDELWRRYALREQGANAAVRAVPDGSRWVLYHSSYVGGARDLWLARIGADGAVIGRPRFSGLQLPEVGEGEALALELGGGSIQVRGVSGVEPPRTELSAIAADGDGDGLTDLEEARLRLDPARADTDGDGLGDAEDPAPNARIRQPASEEQRIELALFEQLFRLLDEGYGSRESLVVVGDEALEWRGRRSTTVTLAAAEADRFRQEAGLDGLAYLTLLPLPAAAAGAEPALTEESQEGGCRARGADERAFDVTFFRGGLNAIWYCAVMRWLGDGWALSRLDITAVS